MAGVLKKRLLTALSAMLLPHIVVAAPAEYEIKAAFIHNIAKFVEWPAVSPASGRAKLCLLGDDPSGGAFGMLQGKQIESLRWEIVPVRATPSLMECRVLFIAASERVHLSRILDEIGDSPVLTMGDTEGYAGQGVMVNFYLEKNKVRFEINQEAARRVGLKISFRLLRLAKVVHQRGREK